MAKPKALQKYYDCFFDDLTETTFTPKEKEQLIRYRHAFHTLLETPWLTTTKLRDELMNVYGISESQAYRDIQNLEILKGNVQNTTREFQQFKVNSALNEALELAITKKDPEKIAYVCSVIGKYNRLDKDVAQHIPIDLIVPREVEFTTDPTILGVKLSERVQKNPQAYVDSLIKKYSNQIELENYHDYEEVTDGE